MKRLALLPLVLGVAAIAAACSSTTDRTVFTDDSADGGGGGGGGGNQDGGGGGFQFDANLPDAAKEEDECRKMDVVFVVDDSGSMAGAQAKLKANFPRMVDTLNAYKTKGGDNLDYRLAVTSTDTSRSDFTRGGRGGFVTVPATSCDPGGTRAWLERSDANVANAFGCRAGLGTAGSATEKPIDGLVMSLTDRAADQNKTFLRDDALLAFFVLTDEEDSSSNTPQQAIQKLDQIKKVRGRWAGAVISGQKSGSCTTGSGSTSHTGYEAPKLHQLVDGAADPATGKNNVIWRTICQESFDTAVKDALDTFTVACKNIPPLPK
ncbi:MAG: hypothetical protein IPK71_13250 [Myxococcales bacterium]|nr:hypothetical protein [Myxococcales bacterium]MBL9110834.1 hypothetical protein [Myxococcales bacterium]